MCSKGNCFYMFMAILALFVVYIFVYFRLIDQTMFVVTETNFHRKAQKYTNKPKMVFPMKRELVKPLINGPSFYFSMSHRMLFYNTALMANFLALTENYTFNGNFNF